MVPVTPISADAPRLATELALLRDDLLEHGWEEHQVDELGIELGSASRGDHLRCRFRTAPVAVTSVVRHRVEGVGESYDARGERNALSAQSVGVALPVPPFMVRDDAFRQVGVERGDGCEDVGPAPRMRVDLTSFRWREVGALVNDVEERFVDLSNVMKQGDPLDDFFLMLVELCGIGKDERVGSNASHVSARLGVVGVDGVEQRLERCGGESLSRLSAVALA